jgi:hypothetical protein
MLTLKPKPGTETHETALYVRMRQSGAAVHELKFADIGDSAFISDLVATITDAAPGRAVSDISWHHEATGFEVNRKAKAISGEIPYSLPLGVAK